MNTGWRTSGVKNVIEGIPSKINRRDFLKMSGVFAAWTALASCTPAEKIVTRSFESEEFRQTEMALDFELSEIDQDPDMSPNAKAFLWSRLFTEQANGAIMSRWEQVAIPQYLREAGLYGNTDVELLWQSKIANGGIRVCDVKRGLRYKIAPIDSPNGVRMAESYRYFVDSWRAIGVPEEYVNKIQLIEAGSIEGKPAVMLVTPDMGMTFESFVKGLQASGAANVDEIALRMVEEYYRDVLMPMNARGIIQPDLNFKNIIVSNANRGPRLIPIDLPHEPIAYGEGMIFQQQYEQLRERAGRGERKIQMPTWDEYLKKYPVVDDISRAYGAIETAKPFKLKVTVSGRSIWAVVPEEWVAIDYASLTPEQRAARIDFVKVQIENSLNSGSEFLRTEQGGAIRLNITTEDGRAIPVVLSKASVYGEGIESFGGRLAKWLKIGKELTRAAMDFLTILWLASEVDSILNPPYAVPMLSSQAFPDSTNLVQRADANVELDYVFRFIMNQKFRWIDTAANLGNPGWEPGLGEIVGLTPKDVLFLYSIYGVPQEEIKDMITWNVLETVTPPAQCVDQFQTPFPIFISGADIPFTAWFSAIESREQPGRFTLLLWGKPLAGDTSSLQLISVFSKLEGDPRWEINSINPDGWKIEINTVGSLVMECRPDSDGKTFELECYPKP